MTIEIHQVKPTEVKICKQDAGNQIAGYDKEDVYADKAAAQYFGKTVKKENGNNCDRTQTINIGAIRLHRLLNSSGTNLLPRGRKIPVVTTTSALFLSLRANIRPSVKMAPADLGHGFATNLNATNLNVV